MSKEAYKTVSANRFLDLPEMRAYSARLNFNRRAFSELLDEAVLSAANAKSIHDELEKYYIPAMDFSKVEKKSDELIERIFGVG